MVLVAYVISVQFLQWRVDYVVSIHSYVNETFGETQLLYFFLRIIDWNKK